MTPSPLIARLAEYYDAHGISAIKFSCPHRTECAQGAQKFTPAKESFVGPNTNEAPHLDSCFCPLIRAVARPTHRCWRGGRGLADERRASFDIGQSMPISMTARVRVA
jgi:hypothetical protein